MSFWTADPVVGEEKADWWKNDPVVGENSSQWGADEIGQSKAQQEMERNVQVPEWIGRALGKAQDVGTEALSAFSPELSARLFGRTAASMRPEEISPPIISPEIAKQIVGQLPEWAGGNTQFAKGVSESTANALSQFSAPGSLAQLPAFAVPGVAETYALNVISELPDQGKKLLATAKEHGWTSKEVGQMAGEYGITDLTAFLAGKTGTLGRWNAARSELRSIPKTPVQSADIPAQPAAESSSVASAPITPVPTRTEASTLSPQSQYAVAEGPPSAEDARGLPVSRPVTQRFVQPEGAPVLPESQTTAGITRDALEWRKGLIEEGQQLGQQAQMFGKGGMSVPKPLIDRIKEINEELAKGFQPIGPQHYEVKGTPDEFSTIEAEAGQRDTTLPESAVMGRSDKPGIVDKAGQRTSESSNPEAGTSNRMFEETYGENVIPGGKGVDTTQLLDNARAGIRSGAVDPYSVLSKTRQSGIANPEEYATLAAEHERLVNDAVAKQKANDPSATEAAQRAEDFANAIQPHKTAASDLMRLFQGDLNYDLSTPFGMEQYMKSELGRSMKPSEKPAFTKRAHEIRREESGIEQAVARSDIKVQRHYAKVRDIPMEEAASRVKEWLKDCVVS